MEKHDWSGWFRGCAVGLMLLHVSMRPAGVAAEEPERLDVPLTIDEPVGIGRKGEPCSTGIPFPSGLLKEPDGLAVVDPNGNAVTAQFRVLERWREEAVGKDDLSIKWLLVTFLADVAPRAEAVYHLQRGQNPLPQRPVRPWK